MYIKDYGDHNWYVFFWWFFDSRFFVRFDPIEISFRLQTFLIVWWDLKQIGYIHYYEYMPRNLKF